MKIQGVFRNRWKTALIGGGLGLLWCVGWLLPAAAAAESLTLWYDQPADGYPDAQKPRKAWERHALPLGNGFLGAMVFGGPAEEHLQLNLHSLWSGGPGVPGWKPAPNLEGAAAHLPEIRQTLLAGDRKKAQALSTEWLRGDGPGDRAELNKLFGAYQTFGDLFIATGTAAPVTEYRRALDLSTALHTVRYRSGGARFTRTAFCSYPDRCLVVRFAADQPGRQNLSLRLTSPHAVRGRAEDGVFVVRGTVRDNGLKLDVRVGALAEGGTVTVSDDGIRVEHADAVTFVLVGGTDYAQKWPTFRGADPAAKNRERLAAALRLGFARLKERHVADHHALHGRVSVDWGSTPEAIRALPTDVRLERNKKTPDLDLEELYFQFGRYLLIASSRPGSLPANLQGLWCDQLNPPWRSDYHLNINLEMNYWPSGPGNLLECQEPLIAFTDSLREPGALTAKTYFNADGWNAHLVSNLWGFTAPNFGKNRPRYWAWFPLGGAWLSTHAWEQYAFGRDEQFLRNTAWPILSGTADFIVDALFELPDGTLSMTPGWSPEHGPISLGATTEIAMAREALTDALAAAAVLGETGPRVEQWRSSLKRLVPYKIGQYGQLQEWYEDIDNPKDKHRHLNHLFGLHPGHQIAPDLTPKLARAARVTLTQRGDGATGWSMGWKINFWARMFDGDHAHLLIRNLLSRGTNPNLFDVHPPFQIDGNFGGCAGMAEMLVQSRYRPDGGEILLLPALPSLWRAGSASGLRARGGFVLRELKWRNGKLVRAEILAKKGGRLIVKYGEKTRKFTTRPGEVVVW
jgi:alpha-L-fucosidase 2